MTKNESLLRDCLAAEDAGDLDAIGKHVHDDVVVHTSPIGPFKGLDTIQALAAQEATVVHDIQEIVTVGSTVAARTIIRGKMSGAIMGGSADVMAVEFDHTLFLHVRDGKIAEVWEVVDTAAILRQLGGL
jgi:predicted ester cyclase